METPPQTPPQSSPIEIHYQQPYGNKTLPTTRQLNAAKRLKCSQCLGLGEKINALNKKLNNLQASSTTDYVNLRTDIKSNLNKFKEVIESLQEDCETMATKFIEFKKTNNSFAQLDMVLSLSEKNIGNESDDGTINTLLKDIRQRVISMEKKWGEREISTNQYNQLTRQLKEIKEDIETLFKTTKKLRKRCNAIVEEQENESDFNAEMVKALETKIDDLKNPKSKKTANLSPIDLQDSINQLTSGLLDFPLSDDEENEKAIQNEQSSDDTKLTLEERFEQVEEKVESFKHLYKESLKDTERTNALQSTTVVGIQLDVAELNDDISSLKTQIEKDRKTMLIYKKAIIEFSEIQSGHTTTIDTLNQKLSDQKELFEHTIKQNQSSANATFLAQEQSISTLQKWIMALGGGYAIALAALLWHYTHK